MARGSDAISPTAHYTGEVWRRRGLGHPALGTWQGRLLHAGLRPALALSAAIGGPTLDAFLLARHRLIDEVLEEAIAAGEVAQVLEIAAGMSPRGVRLRERHPGLVYVEADLPAMAERKRAALHAAGASHEVVDLDALAAHGPTSIGAVAARLERGLGVAIVTEGLLNYFGRHDTDGIWERIGTALGRFSSGLYVADLHLAAENSGKLERAFAAALGAFVRGRVHMPYDDAADAQLALAQAGFAQVTLHSGTAAGTGPGAERVRVVEARTAPVGEGGRGSSTDGG